MADTIDIWRGYLMGGSLALSLIPTVAAAQDAPPVILLQDQADCLARNADAYIERPGDPTLLFPGFCALEKFDPTPDEISDATSINAYESGIIEIKVGPVTVPVPKNPMAATAILTDAQLTCLKERAEQIVRPNADRPDYAEIDFELCRD